MDTNESKPKDESINEVELTEQELEKIVAGGIASGPGKNRVY